MAPAMRMIMSILQNIFAAIRTVTYEMQFVRKPMIFI